jgi:hypothetical protein
VQEHIKSLDTETHCVQPELSFLEKRIIDYEARKTKNALKRKIMKEDAKSGILNADSDSDDSGTTKPSFKEEKINANDVVETALSGREDVAHGSPVDDTDEQVAQLDEVSQAHGIAVDKTNVTSIKEVVQAMVCLGTNLTKHDTADLDLQKIKRKGQWLVLVIGSSANRSKEVTNQVSY